MPKLNLMVRADNLPAKDFYLKIGYSPSDVVVLSRTLGSAEDRKRALDLLPVHK